jgi:alkylhydroperoxidase family enzyme
MLLRVSGEFQGSEVDLSAVNGQARDDGGVAHATELVAFTDAVMGRDDDALAEARSALQASLKPEAFVDACAIIAAFNVVDRIADATGIPLDDSLAMISGDVRSQLDLARFASSANTPAASP